MRPQIALMSALVWLVGFAAGPAQAVSISFADLGRDTVLASERLEFTKFQVSPAASFFDPEDWVLTLIEDEDILRIEHVDGNVVLDPFDFIKFSLNYQVTALVPSQPIVSMGLSLPDEGTSTTDLAAVKVDKAIQGKSSALLSAFDWACSDDPACPGRQLDDFVAFGEAENVLLVHEDVTILALTGQAEFSHADNEFFLAPEPRTATLLLLGLAGLSWLGQPRRPSSSSK